MGEFVSNELNEVQSIMERRNRQKAGMEYVKTNRDAIHSNKEYRGKWIAVDGTGVIAYASELPILKEQLEKKFGNPAAYGLYIHHC